MNRVFGRTRIRSPGNEFDNFEDNIFTQKYPPRGQGGSSGGECDKKCGEASKLDPLLQMREFCPVRFSPSLAVPCMGEFRAWNVRVRQKVL